MTAKRLRTTFQPMEMEIPTALCDRLQSCEPEDEKAMALLKEWLWSNKRDEILENVSFHHVQDSSSLSSSRSTKNATKFFVRSSLPQQLPLTSSPPVSRQKLALPTSSIREDETEVSINMMSDESLLRRISQLESDNARLAAANSKLQDEIASTRRSASSQLRYFACMSHEIRTPLSCIIGLSKLLQDTTDLTAQQRESIHMIVNSGDLLLAVVNDVLDWSKLETGSFQVLIRECNLQDVLSSTIRSIEMQAKEKGIRIQPSFGTTVPENVTTDGRRLQQVLYNLLGNAIKFSKAGGQVELSIKTLNTHNNLAALSNSMSALHASFSRDLGSKHLEYVPLSPLPTSPATVSSAVSPSPRGGAFSLRNAMLSNFRSRPPPVTSCQKAFMDSGLRSTADTTISLADLIEENMTEPNSSQFNQFDSASLDDLSLGRDGCWCESNDVPLLRFEVVDHGVGIQDVDRIFLPFHQEVGTAEHGGTGLGLTITHKLVQALGGRISVESQPGVTTKFTVDIPLVDHVVPKQFLAMENTKILVVDQPGGDAFTSAVPVFDECNIKYECCSGLSVAVDRAQDMAVKSSQTTSSILVLLNEKMDDPSVRQRLQSRGRPIPVVSFGPNFSTSSVDAHVSSIAAYLPSVFISTLTQATRIRRETPNPPQAPVAAPSAGVDFNPTVLIAEDNVINQKLLVRMLKRLGVNEIDVVTNGEKAVAKEATKKYDLVFMDMLMPVMDGVRACEMIQHRHNKNGMADKPYIAFVTAYVSSEFDETCRVAGGDEVLTKPFQMEEIKSCIARAKPLLPS